MAFPAALDRRPRRHDVRHIGSRRLRHIEILAPDLETAARQLIGATPRLQLLDPGAPCILTEP
jgi:hypothetical protein